MKQFFALCVFAFSFASVFAIECQECNRSVKTSIQPGNCPEPNRLPQPFDLNQYLGIWYVLKSTKPYFEDGLRCLQADYKFDTTTGTFVTNSTAAFYFLTTQYWVVDTDYNNYALVVSCNDVLDLLNSRDVWILSRKPTLEDNIVKNLVDKLDSVEIHDIKLVEMVQNC
uniref:Lipocalin/cytosolic fatty-acid binding domain-containing protein n=1 Tax=Tetranychus urticae TaxID=32264 RepID=T1L168_TETUR